MPAPADRTSSAKLAGTVAVWPELQAAAVAAEHAAHRPVERVWLCVALPKLALEAFQDLTTAPTVVVIDQQRNGQAVLACNTQAAAAGIHPGLAVNAARALCPTLEVRARDAAAERLRLHALGDWALLWTSMVHVADEGALLLEVGGSLRLFAGLEALRQKLIDGLQQQGCTAVLACAPTARAALWLACAGRAEACIDRRKLPGVLGSLRLAELGWAAATVHKLRQMGVSTVADCMRLPRSGFVRRLGTECMRELDEALGAQPQLLHRHREPEWFKAQQSFDTETCSTQTIEGFSSQLLERLGHFLRRRQAAVHKVLINLQHSTGPATCVQVELREPVDSPGYLQELLHLHLENLLLQSPVNGLTLTAEVLTATDTTARFATRSLPGMGESDAAEQATLSRELTERLRARLGRTRVYGVALVSEHRPERAWRVAEPLADYRVSQGASKNAAAVDPCPRPLWLLPEPQPIQAPVEQHASSIERIETGWWDGHDVRRDYDTTSGPGGSRWWVYRDRGDSRWYLHGLFG